MSDCVGAPRMPVCRENYPFVCSTIKSPDSVPIEFAIENGASVRIVFLNYQSQKHKHQRSRSRPHVFTALLDNGSDHRAGTIILQAEKFARKPGFACITLLCQHRQSTFPVHESTWFSHRGQTLVVTAFILPHFPHGFSPIDPDLVKKGIIKRCCKYKTAPKTPPATMRIVVIWFGMLRPSVATLARFSIAGNATIPTATQVTSAISWVIEKLAPCFAIEQSRFQPRSCT